ncbi:hypothetical protein M9Y10_005112 [Tritrichomonas musculus]|uniref:Uncharacterized protein n=1 Tax=Tritrichomonas musculus TaxID=1915356 RepID=A0ABR2JKC1_9EUKA
MSRPNPCPIPPIHIPEKDSKRVKIIPLISYYNTSNNSSTFQSQPHICAPSPQRLSSSGRSPRVSTYTRSVRSQALNPFQHIDTDFIFDIIKFEKFDDLKLNNLIDKLEKRLLKLIPDAPAKVQKQKEESLKKPKEFPLIVETTLLFESGDYDFDKFEDDGREKQIKMLEEKLLLISQKILARYNPSK